MTQDTGEAVPEAPATPLPTVRVVVTPVEGADLSAAIAAIRRQAYDAVTDVLVVGEGEDGDILFVESLEAAISSSDSTVDYLWIVHSDARPRPDALASLVREVDRHEAGMGASKLLRAGTRDELESIGSATDVFGEPYSGLDDGEVDLQQYDVVREVAFVEPVSMLVRRDLARGIGGVDPTVPPGAAGLDFSQRARLAGGTVIIVPSSEVYHQSKCGQSGRGWRERAGRIRAMLVAYRLLTLAWVIPLMLTVGLVDSVLNLLFLRWRPMASYLTSWTWNLLHLISTLSKRRRVNSIRDVGDEELFRFQTSGSVRLRSVGDEVVGFTLSVFDDDQVLTRSAKRIWSSPGIIGAGVAALLALIAARGIFFAGVPNVGFSFPLEPPSVALDRFLGGWNDSGLGSPGPVHPVTGLTGLLSLLWFGSEGAVRTLATFGFAVSAIVGMGRLLGRLGLRGPGRYISGLVALAGPGTALATGAGLWTALAAAAILPWSLRAVFVHPAEERRSRLAAAGWAVLLGAGTAAMSPGLLAVPVVSGLMWSLLGDRRARVELAVATAIGGVLAISFISGDPGWLTDASRRLALEPSVLWPGLILLAAIPLFIGESRVRRIGALGGFIALAGVLVAAVGRTGPGVEEAALVAASVGAAIVAGVALDRFERDPARVVASLAAIAMVVLSLATLMGGRLGLPEGDQNDDLSFALSLSDDSVPRRILYVSSDRGQIPGEAVSGPGFWYRVLDGSGTTLDEVWLPEPRSGDRLLDSDLAAIVTGSVLRPGSRLEEYAIGWIVVAGRETNLDVALASQLDIIPLPLDSDTRVYENPETRTVAQVDDTTPWLARGAGFEGDAGSGRVSLAINYTSGWEPSGGNVDWYTSVSAATGRADYTGHPVNLILGYLSAAVLVGGAVMIVIGRRKS